MPSRSVERPPLTNIAGRDGFPLNFLSRWRDRLGTVASTLVEILQARPVPVPVKVPVPNKRRSPRR